jgi:phage gp29-like protein
LLLRDPGKAIDILDSRDGAAEMLAIPQWRIIYAVTRAEILVEIGAQSDAAEILNDAIKASKAIALPQQVQRVLKIACRHQDRYADLRETAHLARQYLEVEQVRLNTLVTDA